MGRVNLKELSKSGLEEFVLRNKLPLYRASQLLHWIYEKGAESIEGITELSKWLRASLSDEAYISNIKLAGRKKADDGTEKFLYSLEDGESIESVLIPEDDRLTLCVSSQAGCQMGCRFCFTGRGGFRRNLKAFEIFDQLIASRKLAYPKRITNIVLMGMGEPLKNLVEVSEALKRITRQMGVSPRRITVSTAGLVKEMKAFSDMAPPVNLAVSLNATTDIQRDYLMPVNRKYPISSLLGACRRYPLRGGRRITFEYVLIGGTNDSIEDAGRLLRMLRGIPSKVNLIPLNVFEGCELKRPSDEKLHLFQHTLTKGGLTAFIRKSKGGEISAACGQLRGEGGKSKKVKGGYFDARVSDLS